LALPVVSVHISDPAGSSAVTKVVKLLEELKESVESDGKEEQKVFDKFACWCEEITHKKAKAITDAKAELLSLGTKTLELKGSIATYISEIKGLTEDIRKNEKSQATATTTRQRENSAFQAERVELNQALTALEQAIVVLKDATKASLLRLHVDKKKASAALSLLRQATERLPHKLQPRAEHLAALSTASVAAGRYSPQSSTIQGILQEMYSSFAKNLESLTKDEAAASRSYEDLMETWKEELSNLQEAVVKKEQAKAEEETILADASQEFTDTEATLGTEIKFFDSAKKSCEAKTVEWSKRKAMRTEELAGIAEALKILTDEDNKALFDRTVKPGFEMFLQLPSSKTSTPLARARGALQASARESHSLRLAALAASLQAAGRLGNTGHFDKVIEAIETLMATLRDEEAEDDKKVVDCKEQFKDIASESQDLGWKIENNEAKITKLGKVVEKAETEQEEAEAELEATLKEIKDMKAMREEDNKKFLLAKSDDEKAIDLLEEAKTALTKYYKDNSVPIDLMQAGVRDTPDHAPEAKFSDKGSRKTQSKGVVKILEVIIEDLKKEISNAVKAEEQDQLDYEERLATSEALVKDLEKKITNVKESIALRKKEIEAEKATKKEHEGNLKDQQDTKKLITPGCEWFIKNQAVRREKRAQEMEGLQQAKDYLAGAGPPALVQTPRQSNKARQDTGLPGITFASVS